MKVKETQIMAVGQVPPPWGGQAVMIQALLDSRFEGVRFHHVPMSFSSDMGSIGRFRWRKLIRLPLLILRIWICRFSKRCTILYYPPGGESVTAIYRDLVILGCCRMLFKKVIFHIHSGGFTDVLSTMSPVVRYVAFLAYKKPDLAIQLSMLSPPDAQRIHATKTVTVLNGIDDHASGCRNEVRPAERNRPIQLLFVGVLSPAKGVGILLEACVLLLKKEVNFRLVLVGQFYSHDFEETCRERVRQTGLEDRIRFSGVLTGEAKWNIFRDSDVFCFPSHFESENQSLVILEAMQFSLPCVVADWRGAASMIEDGENGYLIPVKDAVQMAACVQKLNEDQSLREQMGRNGRRVFLEKFTLQAWRNTMSRVLEAVL